ncbi:hypothetical protein WK33_11315 [Burkholderia multivorans]|nr:hypothetical protein AI46_10305 [Burkholderia multivorans R-20526]KVS14091.1 hypothetical protein WK33_11315 [Burkholderia multivorans]OFT78586.1 hypothetical protein HMPREF3115_24745 [Burkholderia sp. HMSC10F09]
MAFAQAFGKAATFAVAEAATQLENSSPQMKGLFGAVRTTRGPMAERIQFVEFARQTGRQGEVFARADFVEGQRRRFQFCWAATEPHTALPLAGRVELQQPRAPCNNTLADVVRRLPRRPPASVHEIGCDSRDTNKSSFLRCFSPSGVSAVRLK